MNYEITEVCPHCENKITMQWSVEDLGYKAYCQVCGKRLMLCSACHDDTCGMCDYDSKTDSCKFNPHHKIIAVDFDGTLCENKYPEIGKPITPVIESLLEEQKNGAKIILWTCRCDDDLNGAVEWCKEQGIIFDAVNDHLPEMKEKFHNNTRKVFATEYWDDKAVNIISIIKERELHAR